MESFKGKMEKSETVNGWAEIFPFAKLEHFRYGKVDDILRLRP